MRPDSKPARLGSGPAYGKEPESLREAAGFVPIVGPGRPSIHRAPALVPEGLRARAAAHFVGVGRSTWLRWVASGRAPLGLKVGGVRIWPRRDLLRWLEAGAPPAERWEVGR